MKENKQKKKEKEDWKPCLSVKGYLISDLGRVKARFRAVPHRSRFLTRTAQILNTFEDKGGYKYVRLSRRGKVRRYYIHVLVAETFIGPNPDPESLTVDHIDRNRHNNHPENLRYATKAQQTENRELNPVKGEQVGTSKLTLKEVREIRRLKKEKKLSNRKLGLLFDVNQSTIGRIIRRDIWKEDEDGQETRQSSE